MVALIYKPTKTAMQSGEKGKDFWVLEHKRTKPQKAHDVMGWVGNTDMNQEVYLHFDSQKDAENYAQRKGLEYKVKSPKVKKITIQSYSDNFQ